MKTFGVAINNNKGELIEIKTTTKQGNGILKITGSVSEDILNSVKNALHSLQVPKNTDIDIDIQGGRYSLTGPSLGLAIYKGLLGSLNNSPDDDSVVYTGAVSPEGKILAVGGIKKKQSTAEEYGKKLIMDKE